MSTAAPRRRLGDLLRGARRSAPAPAEERRPTLTVVIPVYNVAQYLPECLDSVLGQSFADLEVIAVDDGSTDDCAAILAAYAERDPRLRVLRQENAGQGPARNRAVELARGELVTFCDSDDTVPRKAYEVMVRTLRRTGSDFVVGAARRVKHDKARRVAWGDTVHEFDRLATTIDEFPAAMQDIIACNRMFRTEFWRSRVGEFRGGIAYEDHVPMLTAYVRAERFDVLARVTYNWRLREDNTSTGQQKATVRNLLDRVEVKEEAYALLRAEASDATYDAWVGRCLDVDFPPFLTHALGGSDEYRDVLATAYRTFLDRATERALETVRHDRMVKAWLCAGEHWDALAVADEWFGRGRDPRVQVADGHLVAEPELPPEVTALVPASAWRLAPSETALRAALRSVRRHGGSLRVTGYALVPGLATTAGPPELTAWLVDPESGATRPLPVTSLLEPEIDVWADDAAASYPHSGFAVEVDVDRLVEDEPGPVAWRLRLRVTQGAVTRESGVHDHVEGSAAKYPRREILEVAGRPTRLEPRWSSEGGFEISVSPLELAVAELEPPTPDNELRARFSGDLPAGLRVVARIDDLAVDAQVDGDGWFGLTLPPVGEWVLRASAPGIAPHQQLWPVPGPDPEAPYGEIGPGRVVWRAAPDGMVRAVADGRQVRVRRVELRPGEIATEVVTIGVTEAELSTAVWRGRYAVLPAAVVPGSGSTLLVAPTGERPPPTAAYLLVVRTADGSELEAVADDELVEAVPGTQHTDALGLGLRLRLDRTVVADLGAPLDHEERSPAHQERWRREHRSRSGPPAGSGVLLTAAGEQSDALLAMDRALARTRPDLSRRWAVRDHSVAVPEGASAVLVDSRRWHEQLSQAPAICTAGELPDFFQRGEGQRVLQTFAGYPVAAVGRAAWQARGLNERAVALEAARRREQWSTIIAPTEEVADLYRAELDVPGEVLVTGHPRYDLLVGADREATRARVLAALGIPADRTVTLYAPAHRTRATRALLKGAPQADLDLGRLAAGLGPDHVVLVRGVPHLRRGAGAGALVVDVAAHPSTSDLLLAADAAVLDYSDLRFDWALTGRAAVFHVPDHDDYLAAVRAPIDFDSTTPGPQVTDVDAVVEAVRGRTAVNERYAAEVAAFNQRWHPHHDGHAAERVLGALLGD